MTMFAARLVGPKQFEFFEKQAPDIETATPGSVVVRIRRATIAMGFTASVKRRIEARRNVTDTGKR